MSIWKNRTALITGASYGIGASFASILAVEGARLVLTARSRDRLENLAAALRAKHGADVDIIEADLLDAESPQKIFDATEGRNSSIDLLVNNAGFGLVGDFDLLPLERQLEIVQLNITSLVALSHLFLKPMLARRSGAIINVASTAAFQGVPYFAVYSATKAFVLNFSEALTVECRERNVKVLALCPGPTSTNFHQVAGNTRERPPANTQTPEEVVRTGLEALEKGKSYVVSGVQNRAMVIAERMFSRSFVTSAAAKLYRQFAIPRVD